MKKYISLLSLIAIFFVGMQQIQAQDSRVVEAEFPEAIAKKELHELHNTVALTGDQQTAAYKVLVDLQQNYKGLESNDDIATVQKAKAVLLESAKGKLKNILTQEQFQVYLRSLEKPKK